MKAFFKKLILALNILIFLLVVSAVFVPNTAHAIPCTGLNTQGYPIRAGCNPNEIGSNTNTIAGTGLNAPADSAAPNPFKVVADKGSDLLLTIPGHLALWILQVADYLVWLSGAILNYAVQYSVVDMKENVNKADSVNNAWRTIRDISNMVFIFVLLYAAIQTIIGQGKDTKGLIVRIVMVGVLMNFSLFFTKFIIDISNILALTFYDAIAPGALTESVSGGISNALMEPLQLTTVYKSVGLLEGRKLFIVGIMGTILALIAAFVFFAIAIMFIIRFVVLMFVLVLSPIAFISFILPQTDKYRGQWWDALSGQAFFAPIYFALTWVAIVISRGVLTGSDGSLAGVILGTPGAAGSAAPPNPSDVGVLVNFLILIVLMIASLTIAKEWANKAPGGIGKLTGWALGAAGGATIGLAGRFSRETIGRGGQWIGDNERLKAAAAKGGAKGFFARQTLAGGRGVGGSSFDLRATGIGDTLGAGKAGGKGGFADYRKKKSEEEEKFAKSLVPSEKTLAKAEQAVKDAKTDEERRAAQKKFLELKGVTPKEVKEQQATLEAEKRAAVMAHATIVEEQGLSERIKETEERMLDAKDAGRDDEFRAAAADLSRLNANKKAVARAAAQARTEIEREYDSRKAAVKKVDSAAEERKKAFADATQKSRWAAFRGYNYTAAAQIRKGKDSKTKAAEALKDLAKDSGVETEEETSPETPPTPPAGGGSTAPAAT